MRLYFHDVAERKQSQHNSLFYLRNTIHFYLFLEEKKSCILNRPQWSSAYGTCSFYFSAQKEPTSNMINNNWVEQFSVQLQPSSGRPCYCNKRWMKTSWQWRRTGLRQTVCHVDTNHISSTCWNNLISSCAGKRNERWWTPYNENRLFWSHNFLNVLFMNMPQQSVFPSMFYVEILTCWWNRIRIWFRAGSTPKLYSNVHTSTTLSMKHVLQVIW